MALREALRARVLSAAKTSVHMRAGSTDTERRFFAVSCREFLNDRGAAETATSTPSRRAINSQGYSLHYDHHPAQPRVEEEDRVHRERAPTGLTAPEAALYRLPDRGCARDRGRHIDPIVGHVGNHLRPGLKGVCLVAALSDVK